MALQLACWAVGAQQLLPFLLHPLPQENYEVYEILNSVLEMQAYLKYIGNVVILSPSPPFRALSLLFQVYTLPRSNESSAHNTRTCACMHTHPHTHISRKTKGKDEGELCWRRLQVAGLFSWCICHICSRWRQSGSHTLSLSHLGLTFTLPLAPNQDENTP